MKAKSRNYRPRAQRGGCPLPPLATDGSRGSELVTTLCGSEVGGAARSEHIIMSIIAPSFCLSAIKVLQDRNGPVFP